MAKQTIKREQTKYKNIYFNPATKKYEVKYNFKVYNPEKGKNDYKAKWIYGIATITEAKKALAELQAGEIKAEDKDITLGGVYEIWKKEAMADNASINTFRNTEQQTQVIFKYIPADTKIKNITPDMYTDLVVKLREAKYSEESLHSYNACFRKLIRLAWKKKLIQENPIAREETKKFNVKKKVDEFSPKLITKYEFIEMDEYFKNNSFVRLGVDRYKKYRLMINFLYYTGLRIGELLALTFEDVEAVLYYQGRKIEPEDWFEYDVYHEPDPSSFDGYQVIVNKVFLNDGSTMKYEDRIRDDTKNKKNRVVPLAKPLGEMYHEYHMEYRERGGKDTDRIFDFTEGNAQRMIRVACEKTGIKHHSPHDFRHTCISNMLNMGLSMAQVEMFSGDEQATILSRYSHATHDSKKAFYDAMNNINT